MLGGEDDPDDVGVERTTSPKKKKSRNVGVVTTVAEVCWEGE
jgi:hypothetical protein